MSYAKLQPGGHYQYIYGNTGSFAYDTFIFDPLAGESFSVALTVVDQVNKETPIVFNQKLPGMTSDMTVEDMLKAAGLAKVSTLEETVGDSTKFFLQYDSPYFLGKEYDAGTRCYWQTIFNGSSSGYASALLDAKLQPGGHYQYIYGNSGSFSYGKNGEVIEYAVNKYNADDAASLIANLSKRFSAGGDEAAISNETFSAALALNTLDLGSFVDRAAIQKNMDEDAEMTAGRLAKYIMALENAGVDCTQTTYKGEAANLFTEMKAMAEASGSLDDVYSLVLMVAAYGYCGDAQNDGVEFAKKLIVEAGNISDVQTSAQCIIALIPYKDLEGAQAAIDAAAANIGYSQLPDGGFSYMLYGNESNLDATADAVVALTALGKDVNSTDFMTVIGSTPVGYLVGVADSGLSSYYSASPATEEMSASVALAGLVAYASSCNVSDVKDVVVDPPESPSGSTSQPGNTLAQSGDGMMACAGAAGVLALGAICTLVVTRRKMAVAQDARDIVLK